MVWTCANSAVLFGILKLTNNLRVDDETEKSGLNIKHSTRTGEDAGPWHFSESPIEEFGGVEMEKRTADASDAGGSIAKPVY